MHLDAEPTVVGGHGHAGGQTLHIPFEGSGKGLVKVVDVERQVTFGGAVSAEVEQVGVATQLHKQVSGGGGGQVGGHHRGRTSKEREWRHRHAGVAHRYEVGQPGGGLGGQDGQWVPPGSRGELTVGTAGYCLAGLSADVDKFGGGVPGMGLHRCGSERGAVGARDGRHGRQYGPVVTP